MNWYGINKGEKSLILENRVWSFLVDDGLHHDQVVHKRLITPRFRILNIQASTNSKIVWRAIHIGLLLQTTANCCKSYLVSSNPFCSLPVQMCFLRSRKVFSTLVPPSCMWVTLAYQYALFKVEQAEYCRSSVSSHLNQDNKSFLRYGVNWMHLCWI